MKWATFHQKSPFSEVEKTIIVDLMNESKSSYNFDWHFCCVGNGVMITLDEPEDDISIADTDENEGNTLVDPDEVIIMDDGSEDIAQVNPEYV